MSLGGRSDVEIQSLERQLLGKVDEFGASCGNVSLIRSLGWDDDLYWEVRDRLLDAGDLILGRGRGGSVRRVKIELSLGTEVTGDCEFETEYVAESDLYQPVANVLRTRWVKDKRFRDHLVEITALQGRRETGGKWSRPDVTVASLSTFPYVPGKHFDVTTFEVKPADVVDVTAVYEALAHRRAATQSYVLFHIPDDFQRDADFQSNIKHIVDEGERHGIGVVVAGAPNDYDTWDFRVDPLRHEPAPERLNDFISVQLSAGAKEEVTQWFR